MPSFKQRSAERKQRLHRDNYQAHGAEKTWVYGLHLSLLLTLVEPLAIFLGPVWALLLHHGENQVIETHGRETFNFAFTISVLHVGALALSMFTEALGQDTFNQPFVLMLNIVTTLMIFYSLFTIRRDKARRYPLCWRVMRYQDPERPLKNARRRAA